MPNIGDHLAWNGTGYSAAPSPSATSLAGNGLTENMGKLDVNPGALAGSGLQPAGTQLAVNGVALAGDGLTNIGCQLNVNPAQLAGNALQPNGVKLDVKKAAAVAELAPGADLAAVIDTVNQIITNLKNVGLMSF